MSEPVLHATPRIADVVREQVRAVAIALRVPALGALAVLVLGSALTIAEFITGGGAVDFAPELSMVPAFVGLLFPIGVWKGEKRFGTSFLWLLPVDRRRHALAKVAAGWVCLMAAVLFFLAWLFVLSLVTGGNILGEHTIQLLPSAVVPEARTLDPAALRAVRYAPQPVFWLVPFTAATGTYLLTSAVAVGVRYPVRWMIGVPLGVLLASALGAAADIDWLKFLASRLLHALVDGRYGLDALFTARAESLKTAVVLTTGKTVSAWRGLPDVGEWVLATAFWIGAGLAALTAAALRQRETGPAPTRDSRGRDLP
jgi:hypothetical protein